MEDHAVANGELAAELQSIAKNAGFSLSNTIPALDQSELNALASSGNGFDEQYASHEVADHVFDLGQIIQEAANGQNTGLKAFADQAVQMLAGHLAGAMLLSASPGQSSYDPNWSIGALLADQYRLTLDKAAMDGKLLIETSPGAANVPSGGLGLLEIGEPGTATVPTGIRT